MSVSVTTLTEQLRALGVASRGELARLLGVSATTVYRHLREAERASMVVHFGRGRGTRYAVRAPLFQRASGDTPLYRVDNKGVVHQAATLTGLDRGAVLVRPPASGDLPRLMLGESGDGHFDDLPFYLQDLRPQGFLGRQYAHSLPELPDNPDHWNGNQVGGYLLDHAVDLPGDLLLGDAAVERLRHWRPAQCTPTDFPDMAEHALAGEIAGSSAGGEQPKFPAFVDGNHVLVKFSAADRTGAAAQRWHDLLVCEHLALTTLAEAGLPVAATRLYDEGGRLFLASRRFDRSGRDGRRPALSLTAVDAEFVGLGHGWQNVANALAELGLLDAHSQGHIGFLAAFSDWIENTDQHLGNITLQPHPAGHLVLAPAYDVLPMRHAPRQTELPPTPAFRVPVCRGPRPQWQRAGETAMVFWQRVSRDERISEGFRELAAQRHKAVADALNGADSGLDTTEEDTIGW